MMTKSSWILPAFSLLVIYATSCSSDDTNDNPGFLKAETRLDVAYGTHPRQVYDLYLPEGRSSENTKVIVLVHGGGWTSGDKNDLNYFVYYLREYYPGYAVANINYILAEEGVPAFPNQFLDLGKVVAQLTDRQKELHIQPQFGFQGPGFRQTVS